MEEGRRKKRVGSSRTAEEDGADSKYYPARHVGRKDPFKHGLIVN